MADTAIFETSYIVVITALLPLAALMLVTQANPYHALVIRGILGAIAALVYALFGAADVALTEALVGTMLSITLYAVAVRSSMSMRLGVLAPVTPVDSDPMAPDPTAQTQPQTAQPLYVSLRALLHKHHLRLEIVPYPNEQTLQTALANQEVHTICLPASPLANEAEGSICQLQTRIPRLYSLMQAEIPTTLGTLTCNP